MSIPKRLWAIIVLNVAAFCVSLYQTYHFFLVQSGQAAFRSFCTIGATFDCNAVESSPWASLFGHFPLAGFAAGWYAAGLLIAAMAILPAWRRNGLKALLAHSIAALVASIFYLFIMVTQIKLLCLLCLVVDGLNLVYVAVVWSLKRYSNHLNRGPKSQFNSFAIVSVVALVITALGIQGSFSDPNARSLTQADIDYMAAKMAAYPRQSVPSLEGEHPIMGNPTGKITIIKYSDFQCPSCKAGAYTVHPMVQRHPELVRFEWRAFPLDSACNRMVKQKMHPYACEAAKAAFCMNRRGHFKEFYEYLFDHQEQISTELIFEEAQALGVTRDELSACMESDEIKKMLDRDIEDGVVLGVESTPTFFVNGRKIEGAFQTEVWEALIQQIKTMD